MFKISSTEIEGLKIIEPKIHHDDRGFFFESFRQSEIDKITEFKNIKFIQDNHSRSNKGVLRGLHYQLKKPQTKLIRVIKGKIFDVAVDIRKNSDTYGKWFGIELNDTNNLQLFIPKGFAHGYLTLSEYAEIVYKVSNYYDPSDERCIRWNDSLIKIDWDIKSPIISEKDLNGLSLENAEIFV